jgi:hypothetical protein
MSNQEKFDHKTVRPILFGMPAIQDTRGFADLIPKEVWNWNKAESCRSMQRGSYSIATLIWRAFLTLLIHDLIENSYKFIVPYSYGGVLYIVKLHNHKYWKKKRFNWHSDGKVYQCIWKTNILKHWVCVKIRFTKPYRTMMAMKIRRGYHYWQK